MEEIYYRIEVDVNPKFEVYKSFDKNSFKQAENETLRLNTIFQDYIDEEDKFYYYTYSTESRYDVCKTFREVKIAIGYTQSQVVCDLIRERIKDPKAFEITQVSANRLLHARLACDVGTHRIVFAYLNNQYLFFEDEKNLYDMFSTLIHVEIECSIPNALHRTEWKKNVAKLYNKITDKK